MAVPADYLQRDALDPLAACSVVAALSRVLRALRFASVSLDTVPVFTRRGSPQQSAIAWVTDAHKCVSHHPGDVKSETKVWVETPMSAREPQLHNC